MWYPPFNTGAGYAMGILAGAEMTTFEMRFIALRCKDTIAPTGTIAQGLSASQVNSKGEVYENHYGLTTSQRVYGTVMENKAGRGPCYLRTKGISPEQEQDIYRAYLNMAPSQTLRWLESGESPSMTNVEIEGTEPYIVGGHTASGYWVDEGRRTTLNGLFAAGDVAGGCPQKYVTGALAEGEMAAESAADYLKEWQGSGSLLVSPEEKKAEYEAYRDRKTSSFTVEQLEEAMQKIMDQYAGGISSGYQYNESGLTLASEKIAGLLPLVDDLAASDMDELMQIYELRERLVVCQVLIAHLMARKETRWHSFGENADYPTTSSEWDKYVNSRMVDGKVQILFRDLK
jgi:adenylylsulfate reductase subunit A